MIIDFNYNRYFFLTFCKKNIFIFCFTWYITEWNKRNFISFHYISVLLNFCPKSKQSEKLGKMFDRCSRVIFLCLEALLQNEKQIGKYNYIETRGDTNHWIHSFHFNHKDLGKNFSLHKQKNKTMIRNWPQMYEILSSRHHQDYK